MEDNKQINIVGTNNRYMIKKVLKEHVTIKKRVESDKWNLPDDLNQLEVIDNIINNNQDSTTELVIREINKKISGYKQQDMKKKICDEDKFITFESIIKKMRETELKCRYCKGEMYVLYDKIRDGNQWSVDRVDNDVGHNIDNFHLACLTCNLKRRRTSDDKFLFTKQLSIIKQL
jgi:hypothetical protein